MAKEKIKTPALDAWLASEGGGRFVQIEHYNDEWSATACAGSRSGLSLPVIIAMDKGMGQMGWYESKEEALLALEEAIKAECASVLGSA